MASTSQAASAAQVPAVPPNSDSHRVSSDDTSPTSVSPASQHAQPAENVEKSQPQASFSPAATVPEPQRTSATPQNSTVPLPAPYNRHQYPVQGFPPSGFINNPGQVVVPRSKYWAYAKLSMALCAVAAGAVVLGLSCSYLLYSVFGSWTHIINMPVSIASILWTLGSLITFIACNRGLRLGSNFHEGVHPGAQVGMHLIFWLAWGLALALTASSSESVQRKYNRCISADKNNGNLSDHSLPYSYSDYIYDCDGDAQGNEDRLANSDIPRLKAMVVFCAIALILHFALFIGACVDTHYHNIHKRVTRIVYIPAPPPAMMPPPHSGWNHKFMASPLPGMMHPTGPMHQQPYGLPQPSPYYPVPPQPQHYEGEKSAAGPAPMMSGYYAPAAPASAAQRPEPTQPQIPLGGYYAPYRNP